MRIVIKPGGVIVLGVVLVGLTATVISRMSPKNGSTQPGITSPVAGNASIAPVVVSSVNLLKNGDFEGGFIASQPDTDKPLGRISGNNGANWKDNSAWGDIAVAYASETTNPHGGKNCQKIVISDKKGGQAQFVQTVKSAMGKRIHASIWVRAASSLPVLLVLRDPAKSDQVYGSTTTTIDTEWKQIEVTGSTAASGDTMLLLIVQNPGTVWADDAIVGEVLQ